MKHSLSYDSLVSDTDTSTPSSPLDQFSPEKKPDISESLIATGPKGKKAKTKKEPNESKGSKPKVKKATSGGTGGNAIAKSNGVWNGEKRSLFLDGIIAAGYKSADLDSIAGRLGLSKRQLIDQLVPNKSNLRGKVSKTAKEW